MIPLFGTSLNSLLTSVKVDFNNYVTLCLNPTILSPPKQPDFDFLHVVVLTREHKPRHTKNIKLVTRAHVKFIEGMALSLNNVHTPS